MSSWETITTWNLVLPPSRPSAYHLQVISQSIQNTPKDHPVAILGSTPEYRDLLFELGFTNIFVLEKFERTYKMMSELRCYGNTETVIWGDWLDTLHKRSGEFALILSDLTSGNIAYTVQPTFYTYIANALTSQGLFIDKILTFSDEKKN